MTDIILEVDEDAVEDSDDTDFFATGTSITVTANPSFLSSRDHCGLLFNATGIPAGATISSAVLMVTADLDDPSLDIYAEDVDSSASFGTNADIVNRVKTAASVAWDGTDLGAGLLSSPDLSEVIQEWVDRAGHDEDSNLMLILAGSDRANSSIRFQALENAGTAHATLAVSYTVGGGARRKRMMLLGVT